MSHKIYNAIYFCIILIDKETNVLFLLYSFLGPYVDMDLEETDFKKSILNRKFSINNSFVNVIDVTIPQENRT